MNDKVIKVIEGDPEGIDFLYLDGELEAPRLERLRALLRGSAPRQRAKPKFLLLTDLQEPDGPQEASRIALREGWLRLRVADSYLPGWEDKRPETHVCHAFRPEFSQGSMLVELARKRELPVDTRQS